MKTTVQGRVARAWGAAAFALTFAAPGPQASAQSLRWTRDGSAAAEHFGASLAWLSDRDGDGVDEIVAGAPGSDQVRVVSGRSLALLLEIAGPADSEFGAAVAVVGDLDGDGAPEVAVGAPLADDGAGRVELRSSFDGALLRVLRSDGTWTGFGRSLADLGDVDGDGSPELAVGTTLPSGAPLGGADDFDGAIALVATRDGSVLARRHGWSGDSRYGDRFEASRDLDGDGRRDVATIAWQPDDTHVRPDGARPTLELLSGATLAPIRIVDLMPLGEQTSQALLRCAALGDTDGDGLADVAVADAGPAPDRFHRESFMSVAWVVSGATGKLVQEFHSSVAFMGEGLGSAGDVDRDGCCDLVVTQSFGPGGAPDLQRFVAILSVRTGNLLRRFDPGNEFGPPAHSLFGAALLAERDLDGDAVSDLIVGAPEAAYHDRTNRGRVLAFSTRDAVKLGERWGSDIYRPLSGPCARFGDVDGDGCADVAVAEAWIFYDPGSVALLSGRDGALLGRIAPAIEDFDYGSALAPLPDLDGDGVGDFAIGSRQRIEVRSGKSGALLQELTTGLDKGRVTALAAGVQPDGHVHLIAGQPWFDTVFSRIEEGNVVIYDLTDGLVLHHRRGGSMDERLGSSVAFLGDVTNDGVGDWAAGAPQYSATAEYAGRVAVINGAAWNLQKQLFGTVAHEKFGSALLAVGDVTGDGFGDVVIGAPGAGSFGHGRIALYAGRLWSLVYAWDGGKLAGLGALLEWLGDLNGDGHPEFAAKSWDEVAGPQVEIRSSDSGRLLATIDGRDGSGHHGSSFGGVLGAESPWLDDAARDRTLLLGEPTHRGDGSDPEIAGQLLAFDLPSLFLEVHPRRAPVGATVRGDVRGAPAVASVGILVAQIDGVPFDEFISLGFADPFGDYRDWSIVPPGLAGTAWTLRAYADGFGGHLAESSDVALTFQ